MRKRGPSGGGTLRRESPQQGQWPSPPRGAVASARSQRPRAAHCGLIHCTVKPGKNCIFSPSVAAKLRPIPVRRHNRQPFRGRDRKSSELPGLINLLAALQPKENRVPKTAVYTTHSGRAGTAGRDGADSDANLLWCQEKRLQDIVVRLRGVVTGELRLVEDRPIETAGGGRGTARKSSGYCLRIKD